MVRSTGDVIIVDDNQLTILCHVDIELDQIHAQIDRSLEGHEGILRVFCRDTAMSEYRDMIRLCIPELLNFHEFTPP